MSTDTTHLSFESKEQMEALFDGLGWFTDADDGKQYSFSTEKVISVVLGRMVRDDTPEGEEPVLSKNFHVDVVVYDGLPDALKPFQVTPQHPRHKIGV